MVEMGCVDRLSRLRAIQNECLNGFFDIETKRGLGLAQFEPDKSIDDPRKQSVLRDFAWRLTEETGELTRAYINEESAVLIYEELADVMIFMLDIYILAGVPFAKFHPTQPGEDLLEHYYVHARRLPQVSIRQREAMPESFPVMLSASILMLSLSEAMHELRNQPWKQTLRPTNRENFSQGLHAVLLAIVYLAQSLNCKAADLYFHVMQKMDKNLRRMSEGR